MQSTTELTQAERYAEAMRLHEARLPQTTEQVMLRVHVGMKRNDVNGFLPKSAYELTHVEAARAIIMRGGWPAERGFKLLDLIGKPELKTQFVHEKIAEAISPEYAAQSAMQQAEWHATHTEPRDWCLLCPTEIAR